MSMYPPRPIHEAIDDYAARAVEGGDEASPYGAEFLAEIYAPRVRELVELHNEGFTHAQWGWDEELGYNHWHGVLV